MQPKRPRPSLAPIITRLSHTLAPLYPFPSGDPHPEFPKTILHYYLLTEAQLDSLAAYYHQSQEPASIWRHAYPKRVEWNAEFLEYLGNDLGVYARVTVKRRKFGKFIGLRGCETPVEEVERLERWRRKKWEAVLKTRHYV